MPIDKIVAGYKNYIRLTFKWTNVEDYNTTDSTLAMYEATNQNITWTSSNETVATVTNGIVTAISPGTATITVTTEDGNYTDTCTITVTDPAEDDEIETITTEDINLDITQLTLKQGQTKKLLAEVYPENATNKNVIWTSDNTDVATVSNGVVTAVATGSAKITVKTSDGNDSDTCVVTVTEESVDETLQVTGVDLNASTLSLNSGETETLNAWIKSESAEITIPLEMLLRQYTGENINGEVIDNESE